MKLKKEDVATAICFCCGAPARPALFTKKPVCGECFMNSVQRNDKALHDHIAKIIPGYEHRIPKEG